MESKESISVQIGAGYNKGLIRQSNEDSIIQLTLSLHNDSDGKLFGLYAVADGMGGQEGGEIASKMALNTLAEKLISSIFTPPLGKDVIDLNEDSIRQALLEAVRVVNKEVYDESKSRGNGMGTTLTAALIIGNEAYIANVGDSRTYLLHDKKLLQITKDHSLVADLVSAGEITQEEIYTHPRRNIITRCLGLGPEIEVDLFKKDLEPGGLVVLCSDGLWEMVRDNEIEDVLLRTEIPQLACEKLIVLANQNGGVDNISIVLIKAIGQRS